MRNKTLKTTLALFGILAVSVNAVHGGEKPQDTQDIIRRCKELQQQCRGTLDEIRATQMRIGACRSGDKQKYYAQRVGELRDRIGLTAGGGGAALSEVVPAPSPLPPRQEPVPGRSPQPRPVVVESPGAVGALPPPPPPPPLPGVGPKKWAPVQVPATDTTEINPPPGKPSGSMPVNLAVVGLEGGIPPLRPLPPRDSDPRYKFPPKAAVQASPSASAPPPGHPPVPTSRTGSILDIINAGFDEFERQHSSDDEKEDGAHKPHTEGFD